MGILAGANVIMPNLSPDTAKDKYMLYDNKLRTGLESVEGLETLKKKFADIGYEIVTDRGDYKASYADINSIELYDEVLLNNGRKAAIVEIFDNSFVADIETGDGDYDTRFIYPQQILKIIKHN